MNCRLAATVAVMIITAAGAFGWNNPTNAGGGVNSASAEISPNLNVAMDHLYFASNRAGGSGSYDIYMSTWYGSGWGTSTSLATPLNTSSSETDPCVNSDETRIYFTSNRAGGYGGYDIWFSNKSGGLWAAASNLGSAVNTSASEQQPTLTANNNIMYFCSDRGSGEGGFDLWSSTYSGGAWQTPVNLGFRINSAANELSPSVSSDGNRLYFHSNRGGGIGGYDIWVSERVGGVWQPPYNLGTPLNSTLNEQNPQIGAGDVAAYFDVADKGGGMGGSDIWISNNPNAGVTPASFGRVKAMFE